MASKLDDKKTREAARNYFGSSPKGMLMAALFVKALGNKTGVYDALSLLREKARDKRQEATSW